MGVISSLWSSDSLVIAERSILAKRVRDGFVSSKKEIYSM